MTPLQTQLFSIADPDYQAFHAKLLPTVPRDRIIGIRTPALRKFAKAFAKTPEAASFLQQLPHTYYEENNLHAFVVETIRDYDTAMAETVRFLPYIDNWATCDMFSPKVFQQHPDAVYTEVQRWLQSTHTYTVRYGIVQLMSHFLDEHFAPEMPEQICGACCEEYYINMAIAWYFATALAKQYDTVLPYLLEHRLSAWVHNKTIQKAIESKRIDGKRKEFLRTLKVKLT